MNATHVNAGARGSERLVLDDRDRYELLERLRAAFGGTVLAYCLMDTHVHVVAEGGAARAAGALRAAIHGYAYGTNRRRRRAGEVLRGPVHAVEKETPEQLGQAIRYVHENPRQTRPPLVSRAYEYVFSSRRAFANLVRSRTVDVLRARELLGPGAGGWAGAMVPLADAEPVRVPTARPEKVLVAAAQVLEVDPASVASRERSPLLAAARALYVRLGTLESYEHSQLAEALGRGRSMITRLASLAVPEIDVRRARTLLRVKRLRERLLVPLAVEEAVAATAGVESPGG